MKGKKILELGCGGGQCSIFLSKNGAVCSGIDISKKQIEYAKKLATRSGVKVDYYIGSGENLKQFKDKKFDIVLSVFAMQYISNLDKCFGEVHRILRKGGRFIFSIDNPIYSIVSPATMRVEGSYNSSGLRKNIKTNDIIKKSYWSKGNTQKFIYYFRKLGDIHESLIKSHFVIEKILEPFSDKEKGPWDDIYSHKLAKQIPPTVIFVARNQTEAINKS